MSKKADKAERQKPRLTSRHLVTGWLALVLAGTGAWYAFLGMPDGKEIERLDGRQTRVEQDLEENRERVAQIEEQITGLEQELADAEASYTTFAPYVREKAAGLADVLSARFATAGLEITNVTLPPRWTPTAPQHYIATFVFDASGTFETVLAAFADLEQEGVGFSLDELQIVKAGGDPGNPTLTTRFAVTTHARQAPESH